MTTAHTDESGRLAAAREKVSETTHAAIDGAADAFATAREKASGTAHAAIDGAADAFATAREKASETAHAAIDGAADAFATAREKASSAYSAARERTEAATRAAAEGIEANPLVALVGGIAVGLIAGVLLPRSQKEAELLGPVGTRLADAAREALSAAKAAGLASFDEAGLNRDAVQQQVGKLFDNAGKAASAAGGAAVQAVKAPA